MPSKLLLTLIFETIRTGNSKKEYQPSLFSYLVDSCHIDPQSLLPYRTTRAYFRNGRIVCDRILVSSEDALNNAKKKKRSVETIHAMDVVLFTLVSNPWLKSPFLATGDSLANFITSLQFDSTVVSTPSKPSVSRKKDRVEELLTSNSKLDRISDPRLKENPQNFNYAAKLRATSWQIKSANYQSVPNSRSERRR